MQGHRNRMQVGSKLLGAAERCVGIAEVGKSVVGASPAVRGIAGVVRCDELLRHRCGFLDDLDLPQVPTGEIPHCPELQVGDRKSSPVGP